MTSGLVLGIRSAAVGNRGRFCCVCVFFAESETRFVLTIFKSSEVPIW